MNKVLKYSVASLAAMLLTTGCIYKNSAGVSNVEISNLDMNTVSTLKMGESCQSNFLIFPTGMSATAEEAVKKGGISKISYQEVVNSNYLIGSSHCLRVY